MGVPVFDRPPEPLDKHVVAPGAPAVDADHAPHHHGDPLAADRHAFAAHQITQHPAAATARGS